MIGSTAVSSVPAVDYRSITTNTVNVKKKTPESTKFAGKTVGETREPPEQGAGIHTEETPQGVLTKFRQGVREFTFGILRPASNLIPKIAYETSASQTMENLQKKHSGALTGFHNSMHGFAFGIMRPATGVIGEKIYNSSNSMTLDNLSKEHIGAAAGIKNTLRKYAKAAVEATGPPVAIAEPIRILEYESPSTSQADIPRNIQPIDMCA